jgi:urease beta subunit
MDIKEFEAKWNAIETNGQRLVYVGSKYSFIYVNKYKFFKEKIHFYDAYLFVVGTFRLEDIVDVKSKLDEESEWDEKSE